MNKRTHPHDNPADNQCSTLAKMHCLHKHAQNWLAVLLSVLSLPDSSLLKCSCFDTHTNTDTQLVKKHERCAQLAHTHTSSLSQPRISQRTLVDVLLSVVEWTIRHIIRPVVRRAQILLVDSLPCKHNIMSRTKRRQTTRIKALLLARERAKSVKKVCDHKRVLLANVKICISDTRCQWIPQELSLHNFSVYGLFGIVLPYVHSLLLQTEISQT